MSAQRPDRVGFVDSAGAHRERLTRKRRRRSLWPRKRPGERWARGDPGLSLSCYRADVASTNLPDWLGQLLFGIRHVSNAGSSVNDSDTVNLIPPLVATWNPVTGKIDVTNSDAAASLVGSGLMLGAQVPPQFSEVPGASVSTTNGETVALVSPVPIGAGQLVTLRANVQAKLATPTQFAALSFACAVQAYRLGSASAAFGQLAEVVAAETNIPSPPYDPITISAPGMPTITVSAAADNGSGLVRLTVDDTSALLTGNTVKVAGLTVCTEANDSWTVTVINGTHLDLQGSALVRAGADSGSVVPSGAVGVSLGAASVSIVANGIQPARWLQSQAVTGFDVRWDSTSNRTYVCVTAGTTSNAGTGPSGTGTGIVDGTAHWDYAFAGRQCPIVWLAWDVRWGTS